MKKILLLIIVVSLFMLPLSSYAYDEGNTPSKTYNGTGEITYRYIPCPEYSEGHKISLKSYTKDPIASGSHVLNGLTCYWIDYKITKVYFCECGYGYRKEVTIYREEDCNYWL